MILNVFTKGHSLPLLAIIWAFGTGMMIAGIQTHENIFVIIGVSLIGITMLLGIVVFPMIINYLNAQRSRS